jgi:hypothetical protein
LRLAWCSKFSKVAERLSQRFCIISLPSLSQLVSAFLTSLGRKFRKSSIIGGKLPFSWIFEVVLGVLS